MKKFQRMNAKKKNAIEKTPKDYENKYRQKGASKETAPKTEA